MVDSPGPRPRTCAYPAGTRGRRFHRDETPWNLVIPERASYGGIRVPHYAIRRPNNYHHDSRNDIGPRSIDVSAIIPVKASFSQHIASKKTTRCTRDKFCGRRILPR